MTGRWIDKAGALLSVILGLAAVAALAALGYAVWGPDAFPRD